MKIYTKQSIKKAQNKRLVRVMKRHNTLTFTFGQLVKAVFNY